MARETKREWGTVTPAVSPSFPFKSEQAEPFRPMRRVEHGRAAFSADDPTSRQMPQRILPAEAEATCARPRAEHHQCYQAARRG